MRLSRYLPQVLAAALTAAPVFAQNNGGDFPSNAPMQAPYPQTTQNNYPPPPPPNGNMQGRPDGSYPHFPSDPQSNMVPVPAALTVPAGKYLTVRINNFISTDRNQPGDFFTATLTEPLVIDGFVVAARGQVVNGRVVDVEKAGRVKGVSSMRVELTELNLVDGQQIPFHSQMIYRHGQTSVGNDVAAVGGTAAVGAAIGAAATGSGLYAGVGALAGAAAATIGVLSTRGRPTVITPESLLTFRVEQPVTVSTVRSPGAFSTVAREDYDQPRQQMRPGYGPGPNGYGAGVGAYPGAYPYYGSYGSPYWNTGLFLYGGPRFYGGFYGGGLYGGGFYGRGFYGRGFGRR